MRKLIKILEFHSTLNENQTQMKEDTTDDLTETLKNMIKGMDLLKVLINLTDLIPATRSKNKLDSNQFMTPSFSTYLVFSTQINLKLMMNT